MEGLVFLVIFLVVAFVLYRKYLVKQRQVYIRAYAFRPELTAKISKAYPQLDDRQIKVVQEALKDYFIISNKVGKKFIAMPSQVVDELWHEFILHTRAYEKFCKKAFSSFLHHIPTEGMTDSKTATEGIRRTWKHACELENIDPYKPSKLPRLFLLDGLYEIPNGFYYKKDCTADGSGYCASHIGDCGSSTDTSSSCGSSTDSSCGSGCGGD